jgi:hypothetical protein
VKKVLVFFKEANFVSKLLIIKSFLDLPAILFHELTHIVTAFILCVKILRVEVNGFYKVEGDFLVTQFKVTTSANNNFFGWLRQFFICISPLLGMCGLVWFFPNYFVLCYIGFSFNAFFMSDVDITNGAYQLQQICKSFTQHNTKK